MKERCEEDERRRAVARMRAARVHLDVIGRKFSSNYVPSLSIILIFRFLGVMPTLCFDI